MKIFTSQTFFNKLTTQLIILSISFVIFLGFVSAISPSVFAIACTRCSNNFGCELDSFNTNDASCTTSSAPNGTSYPGDNDCSDAETDPRDGNSCTDGVWRQNAPPTQCGPKGDNWRCNTYYNNAPRGNFDGINISGNYFYGWACDQDDYNSPIWVHVYVNGPYGTGTIVTAGLANTYRADVAAATWACGGTGAHGFYIPIPDSLKDGVARNYYIHAINDYGSNNPVLPGSPRTLQMIYCTDRCSNNYGCTSTGAYIGRASCSDPHPGVSNNPPYYTNLTCPRLNPVPAGGHNNNCPPVPTISSFTIAPVPRTVGESATLSWNATAGSTCRLSGDVSATGLPATGTRSTGTFTTARIYSYTLICSNASGDSAPVTRTISVTAAVGPTVTLTVNSGSSATINSGEPATLYWQATGTGTITCNASSSAGDWTGAKAFPGNETKNPTNSSTTSPASYSYTLTCTNGTLTTRTVTVTVNPVTPTPPPPTPPPSGGFVQTPGVIFNGGNDRPDYGSGGLGMLSRYNWLTGSSDDGMSTTSTQYTLPSGQPLNISYAFLKTAQEQTGNSFATTITCSGGVCQTPTVSGVYHVTGNTVIGSPNNPSQTVPAGVKVILLVDGDAILNSPIKVALGGIFILASSRNVRVFPTLGQGTAASDYACNVSQTAAVLQGIYSAHANFIVDSINTSTNPVCVSGIKDQMLIIDGTVITNADLRAGGNFDNNRDLCENNLLYPAVSIRQRPDFIVNFPDIAKSQKLLFREVAP